MLYFLRFNNVCLCIAVGAGLGGHVVLDEYGDRDVNFSFIYMSMKDRKVSSRSFYRPAQPKQTGACVLISFSLLTQYETLLVFDSSQNRTIEEHPNPDLGWKGRLPNDEPENPDGNKC